MGNKNYNFNGILMNLPNASLKDLKIEVIKTNPLDSSFGEKSLKNDIKIKSDGTFSVDLQDNFDKNAVVIRVLDSTGKELLRNVHNDVQEKNEVNMELNPKVFMATPSVGMVSDMMRIDDTDVDYKNIDENGIVYLSEKMKLPISFIENVVDANLTSVKKIPKEFNMALLNKGIKKEDLFTLPIYESMEIYRNEIEKNGLNIKPSEFKKIEKAVLSETTKNILARKSFNSISSVGEMLELTTKDVKKKEKILDILFHSNDEEAVKEDNLKKKLSPKMFEDFKLNTQLGTLTFNNAPLIKKLKSKVTTVEDFFDKGLYEETELASFVKGTITKDKEEAYISTMIKQLEKEFPERIMAREIQEGNINIKDKKEVINKILKKPNFKLAQKGISHYEKEFEEITDKTERIEVKNEFGKLNRVFALTNNRTMMKALLDKGFDSALKIVGTGQNTFLNTFKEPNDKEKAKAIFRKSQKKINTLTHISIANNTMMTTPMPNVISPKPKGVKKTPDLEELFGDFDFCSCGHCESVLSPAAYLVDLLEFLKDDGVVNKLLEKRPDIEHIELTCENTETVLPYIDLVNEVLEYWVVNENLNQFTGNNIHNESSESLLAEPVHVQDKAYDILAKEIFPLNLPFDREKKLEQSFLSSIGTSRLEILNLLHKKPIDDSVMIQEKLNMNEKLYEIFNEKLYENFTEDREDEVAKLYGFDKSVNLHDTLSNAKLFCHHVDLEYEELLRLVKTKFIDISLIYEKATNVSNMYICSFSESKMTQYTEEVIGGDDPNKITLVPLEKDTFLKLILFIRLYKHLYWSIEDVDLLLRSTTKVIFKEILLKVTFINDLKTLLSLSDNQNLSHLLTLLDRDSEEDKKKVLALFLQIDVSTLEDWITLVGIKPFEWEDGKPLIIDFIQKMKDLQSVGVELSELNYLFRDIDKTNQSKISIDEIMTVRNLIFEEYKSIEELSDKRCRPLKEEILGNLNEKNQVKKEIEELKEVIQTLNKPSQLEALKEKKLKKESLEITEKKYSSKIQELKKKIEIEKQSVEQLKVLVVPKILSEHVQSDIQMIELLLKRIPLIENGFLISENDIIVKYSNKVSRNPDSLIKKEKIETINFGEEKKLFPEKTDSNADYVAASFSFALKRSENYELIWEASSELAIEIKIDDEVQKLSEKILIEANRVYSINIIVSNIKNKDDFFKLFYKIEGEEEKKILSNNREYGQLLKSLQWINTMELSLLEVDYFMTEETIKNIPVLEDITDKSLKFLISKILTISKYQKIKKELNINNDDLIKFLLDSSKTYLYQFVSWKEEDVNKLLEYYDEKLEDLTIDRLCNYTEIFILSKNSGLSINDLLKFINNSLTLEELKNILKTNYDNDSWLKLLKNTYNPIRTAQRDALVSHVLHKLKSNETTDHINTQEKLFEYFLIDVAMDSCMKTSRIKQAISSIQLFIQRCLYNLENVSPSSINLEKWEWAKNYRVWEANRKLFLYPENWLDPSLRSTKTPFFKELEGELLQLDINEDLATKALLTYLEKVDKVSHLEVCGMCKEEDSERIHVIGRTSGIKRVYYHRVYDGTWSPWEQVVLDLEDGPVIPVFWKGRLFLYWTTILPKGEMPSKNSDQTISSDDLKNYIEVNLNWSEYYNNKWQEKRTSDFNEAIKIYLEAERFNKNHLKLEYIIDKKNLLIGISKNEIYYGHYTFYNTQSLPKIVYPFNETNIFASKKQRNLKQNSFLKKNFYLITDFSNSSDQNDSNPFFIVNHNNVFLAHFNKKEKLKKIGNSGRLDIFQKVIVPTYNFTNFSHPFIGEFITRLNKGELSKFMRSDLEIKEVDLNKELYQVKTNTSLQISLSSKKLEFSTFGAYSIYNWEIFYHIPITIAVHLSKNQRFEEAQKWFHFIFNPLTNEKEDPTNPTARYWNFKDFREHTDVTLVTKLMEDLSEGKDTEEIKKMKESIKAWEKTPFDPHTVAKFRPVAYQLDVVMKYIDNLIAWGDSLFRKFTIESLNEATQFYVLAANILGDKPKEIPNMSKRPKKTYAKIKGKLDDFSNIMVQMETEIPLVEHIENNLGENHNPDFHSTVSHYFCIPKNPKLLAYWDLVEDRLFKIRHCMDIEGKVRQIPLFQPSIDPGMLVKAAGRGMNANDVLSGVNEPHSPVKFVVLAQKATELINEVRSLGNSLLSAIEKGDNERLVLLRQTQEIKVLELSQDLKFLQWKETESSIESLIKTRESAYLRYKHYQILLGKEESDFSSFQNFSKLNKHLTEENFDDVYNDLVGNYIPKIDSEEYREEKMGMITDFVASTGVNLSLDLLGVSKNLNLNKGEEAELNVYSPLARTLETTASITSLSGSFLALAIPQFTLSATPFGVGISQSHGGQQQSQSIDFIAKNLSFLAGISSNLGQQSLKLASYQRRIDEWVLQSNLASKELEQIGRQIITSTLREQITKKEYENHKVQIENSKAIDTFMKEKKFGTAELYLWMQGEVSQTYSEFYKLAFDTAKKAEATMKYELRYDYLDKQEFIQFNYWDTGRKGLLAGDKLSLDMKKLELAYLEANQRELELTKHISLQQLDPMAILSLKTTGSCMVDIPEWLFDMETAGHYIRRIKTVSLSIPCVVGTYTSINCTLTLEKSELRTSTINDLYNKDGREESFHSESIVTSGAQNDSGVFELNLRDEKYLPFEGAGAISRWKLELPTEFKQFDYNTISDVIMHMRYTARADGVLKKKANNALNEMFKQIDSTPLVRVFSLKHDFFNEWHEFKESENKTEMILEIRKEHFPYFVQERTLQNISYKLAFEEGGAIEETKIIETIDKLPKSLTLSHETLKSLDEVFLVFEYSISDSK